MEVVGDLFSHNGSRCSLTYCFIHDMAPPPSSQELLCVSEYLKPPSPFSTQVTGDSCTRSGHDNLTAGSLIQLSCHDSFLKLAHINGFQETVSHTSIVDVEDNA